VDAGERFAGGTAEVGSGCPNQQMGLSGSYVHLRWAANPSEVLNEVPRGSVGQEA